MRKLLAVLFGLMIALGSLVMTSSPAAADHSTNPNVEGMDHIQTSYQTECGAASVTLTVPDTTPVDWVYRLQMEVDNVIIGSTELVKGPGSSTVDLSFEEDESDGSVAVSYYFLDATEWDIVDVDMNYKSTYPDVGDKLKSFEVNTDCVQPTQSPSPSPSESPSATPSATPSAPVATVSPAATQPPVAAGLPVTGSSLPWFLGAGAALLGLGGGLMFLGRRRRVQVD